MNKILMKIGKRIVGPNYKPLIIVELGINHSGSLKKQKNLWMRLTNMVQKLLNIRLMW